MNARRVGAAAVWTISWALAITAMAIFWGFGLPTVPLPGVFLSPAPLPIRSTFAAIGVTVALLYGPVSALLISRRAHLVGAILAVHAIGSGLAALGVQWGLLGAAHDGLPLWGLLAFAAGWGYVPGTFMTAVLPVLVTRRALGRSERGLVLIGAIAAVAAFAVSLVQQSVASPHNPFAVDIPALQRALSTAYTLLSFVAVVLSVVTCALLLNRLRRAEGRERRSTAWLTLGHVFLTVSYAALVLPDGVAVPQWLSAFALLAPVIGQILYPAAILVVVLGQRLWGVELVVSRLALWGLLTVSGVVIYLLAVLMAPLLLPGADELWIGVPVIIALAASPMRRWLQRRIDLLIYGEGADAEAVLARLVARVGDIEPDERGLQDLCDGLRGALRLGGVEIRSLRTSLRASVGVDAGEAVVLPLGSPEAFGDLVVHAPEGQRLDARTIGVLRDVSGLVAVAITLIESTVAVDDARAALLSRRADERRSVRRQLHDGLGPSLAGIGFGLAAVENLLDAGQRDRASDLLEELSEDLSRRVRAVRALSAEVSTSPLSAMSLGEALGHLADRFTSAEREVRVHLRAGPEIPPAHADAAYFIAAEAMTNAVRHTTADRIDVRITREGDGILVRVEDDGDGFGDEQRPGVGLSSMRERVRTLRGDLRVISDASGTVVRAHLPVRPAAGHNETTGDG